jgi:hypothetical protein
MRIIIAVLAAVFVALTADRAEADPYRWCAVYSGGETGGGGSNCYFITLEQCQAQISGMGGFCEPNQFYDGRPVMTPDEGSRPRASTGRARRP